MMLKEQRSRQKSLPVCRHSPWLSRNDVELRGCTQLETETTEMVGKPGKPMLQC